MMQHNKINVGCNIYSNIDYIKSYLKMHPHLYDICIPGHNLMILGVSGLFNNDHAEICKVLINNPEIRDEVSPETKSSNTESSEAYRCFIEDKLMGITKHKATFSDEYSTNSDGIISNHDALLTPEVHID